MDHPEELELGDLLGHFFWKAGIFDSSVLVPIFLVIVFTRVVLNFFAVILCIFVVLRGRGRGWRFLGVHLA